MYSDNIFYTYIYLDPRKPGNYVYGDLVFNHEPFYVGKGKGRQFITHLYERVEKSHNSYKCRKIKKIQKELNIDPVILKVKENLIETEAFDLEIKLINIIGRVKNGGPLTNMTDGGEGMSGYECTDYTRQKRSKTLMGHKHSPETKAKIREAAIGRKSSKETNQRNSERNKGENNAMFGKHHTPETKAKISAKWKGRQHSDKTKKQMSESQIKRNDLIKKPVLAMNIWFESLYEAMKFLNISYDKIYNRIINDFTGYRYLYTINRSDHHRIN